MLVVSREKLDDDKIKNGRIVIGYIKEDSDYVIKNIIEPLENNGYKVDVLEKTLDNCKEFFYFERAREKISKSKCGIFVFSKYSIMKKYKECMQAYFYEIGILEGSNKKIFTYLINEDNFDINGFMNDKPISILQSTSNISKLFNSIEDLKLEKIDYFSNHKINRYAKSHIEHVKLTVIINLYKTTLEEIWLDGRWDKKYLDENFIKSIINDLFNDIVTGAIIVRFGKDEHINNPAFYAYKDECEKIEFDSPAQYDKTSILKAIKQKEFGKQGVNDIATTIKMEFLLPVHKVLGVTFKPFFEIKPRSKWKTQHVIKLLEDNAIREIYDNENVAVSELNGKKRVYFLIPVDIIDCDLDISDKYGKCCNFLYPR